MDNDFRPTPSDRPRWKHLREINDKWVSLKRRGKLPSYLQGALNPWMQFVRWHRNMDIPWKHRLYILLNGRLPEDF